MCDAHNCPILLQNADKVLFAEDFVNNFLLQSMFPLLSSGIADHRAFIYNAFNSQVCLAANYVHKCLKDEIYNQFVSACKENHVDAVFLNYVVPLKDLTLQRMRSIAFGAQSFMEFCVKISAMATHFYNHGYLDAPGVAVQYIVSIIHDIDMVQGEGWKALDRIAADYTKHSIDTDRNYLTPEASIAGSSSAESWTSDSYWSSDSSNGLNSGAHCSPEQVVDGEDGQDEHPKMVTDEDYRQILLATGVDDSGEHAKMIIDEDCRQIFLAAGEDHPGEQPKMLTDEGFYKICIVAGEDDKDGTTQLLTNKDFCNTCIAAVTSSSEKPVPWSFTCEHVKKTINVITENVSLSLPDNSSDFMSSKSSKEKNDEDLYFSFEEKSSEDHISKQ